jgi:hypothetical protein
VSRGCIPDYSGMSYEKLRATGVCSGRATMRIPAALSALHRLAFSDAHERDETFEKDLGTVTS